MNETTLHVRVGGAAEESLRRAAQAMKAIERGEQGRVLVPWTEIIVDMRLPERAAA